MNAVEVSAKDVTIHDCCVSWLKEVAICGRAVAIIVTSMESRKKGNISPARSLPRYFHIARFSALVKGCFSSFGVGWIRTVS